MKSIYTQILLLFLIVLTSLSCDSNKKGIDTSGNLKPKVEKSITIYGSENCDHCIEFRNKVDSLKIKYVFKDAEANENYYNELVLKIQQANFKEYISFPVIEIDGKLFVRPELDDFLKALE